MKQIYVEVKSEEDVDTRLYRKDWYETELDFQMGAGFCETYEDGSPWFGTIYYVTNYPESNMQVVTVSIDDETYKRLSEEPTWGREHWSVQNERPPYLN